MVIRISLHDSVLLVSLNSPQTRNCVSPAVARELYQAFVDFEKGPAKVAVLHGMDYFCAGFDLNCVSDPEAVPLLSDPRGPMGPTRLKLSKPVIAAVEGYAVAGGLELALWCDLVVSHKKAVFGVFCRRFGVPLIDGGTIRLAKVVGINRARDLVLTGRPLEGEEAFSWGLVNRLVSRKEQVLPEALKLAAEIAKFPFACLQTDRASLEEAAFPNLERDMRTETRLGLLALADPSLRANVAKFRSRL